MNLLEIIDELNKLDKLKNKKKILKDDNKKLKESMDLFKKNNENLI